MSTSTAMDFLVNHLEERKEELAKAEKLIRANMAMTEERVDFPFDVFPPLLKDMIIAYCRCYGSEPAHYGLTMLTVAGACVGNSVWIKERNGEQPPLLYGAIVDLPGRGKTPIIETFLKPIYRLEEKYRKEHAEKLRAYREAQANNDENINPPLGRELVLNNFTVESVYSVLSSNPRGAIVFKDELAGWIRSMDAYKSKGSEEQFWLEVYNAGLVKVNRKSSLRPLYIKNAFCAVVGGTQPDIIEEFGQGSKGVNGFLARILFAYPDDMDSSPYSSKTPGHHYAQAWDRMVKVLISLPIRNEAPEDEFDDWTVDPILMSLSSGATKLYVKFFDQITEQENAATDDPVKRAMITKHKSHCLRLALILHWLDYAEAMHNTDLAEIDWTVALSPTEIEEMEISAQTMARAIRLDQYFLHTSLKVVGRLGSPIDRLIGNVRAWYDSLPENRIHRNEAVSLGITAKMSKRTVSRYLANERGKIFKRIGAGYFEKLY